MKALTIAHGPGKNREFTMSVSTCHITSAMQRTRAFHNTPTTAAGSRGARATAEGWGLIEAFVSAASAFMIPFHLPSRETVERS